MDVLSGPVVILDGSDCTVLAPQLIQAFRLAYTARGRPPPRHLLDFAGRVSALVRAAEGRTDAQVSAPPRPARGRGGPSLPVSDQPATVSTAEAARLAQVHPRTIVKWIARGDVATLQIHKGAIHRVVLASLALKIGQRRREDDEHRAA